MGAKTIQIVLPDGDPRGIRIAEITTRIVKVIEVPRDMLGQFCQMPESNQVALYFLVGSDSETDFQELYIGQSGGLRDRLKQHGKEKIFWNRALVVVSLTNSLTQTHTLFLEWLSIKEAQNTGRFTVVNRNDGNKPYTPAPLEADCMEIYDTTRTLLATLGYPVFEPALKKSNTPEKQEIFVCKSSEADGRGVYTDEGFVVLAGSNGRRENVPSIVNTADERFREKLISEGVMRVEGNRVVFDRDYIFKSPSTAAVALMGRTANGWVDWKTPDGKTLHEVKRSDHETGAELAE
ncbi:MAG TPA: GIY-YIG nuclease family protein [Acidobacteriaceae bacterium]